MSKEKSKALLSDTYIDLGNKESFEILSMALSAEKGEGVHASLSKEERDNQALGLYIQSANRGNELAMSAIVSAQEKRDLGFDGSKDSNIRFYKILNDAVKHGNNYALSFASKECVQGNENINLSKELLEETLKTDSKKGDDESTYLLAKSYYKCMFESKIGEKTQKEKASELYLAIEKSKSEFASVASCSLGMMHFQGDFGDTKDKKEQKKALDRLENGGKKGVPNAYEFLGELYEKGIVLVDSKHPLTQHDRDLKVFLYYQAALAGGIQGLEGNLEEKVDDLRKKIEKESKQAEQEVLGEGQGNTVASEPVSKNNNKGKKSKKTKKPKGSVSLKSVKDKGKEQDSKAKEVKTPITVKPTWQKQNDYSSEKSSDSKVKIGNIKEHAKKQDPKPKDVQQEPLVLPSHKFAEYYLVSLLEEAEKDSASSHGRKKAGLEPNADEECEKIQKDTTFTKREQRIPRLDDESVGEAFVNMVQKEVEDRLMGEFLAELGGVRKEPTGKANMRNSTKFLLSWSYVQHKKHENISIDDAENNLANMTLRDAALAYSGLKKNEYGVLSTAVERLENQRASVKANVR
jgi:hypothetical protein